MLTDEQAQLLLEPNLAHVATLRRDGSPHVTVTWVDWDGANVIVNTAHGRAKPRHVRRDPRVAVEVVDRNDAYRYVSVTGRAELVDQGAEEHINELSHRYRGRDFSYREGERRVMMRIRPERVYAYGFDG